MKMDAKGQASLADAVLRLIHAAERLQRDVERLVERIEPLSNDRPFVPSAMPVRTMADAFEAIETSAGRILSSEYHVAAIRSALDVIQNDVQSREEMKRWLRDPGR
jgi:hypothetical protein